MLEQSGQSDTRTPGYFVVDVEPLETAGVVRLTIKSGTVDFAIMLDLEEAIDLHRAVAHAARTVCEAAA
jgi:hypothetical protein